MLTALNAKKQIVRLTYSSSKEKLRELRNKEFFYCPACKQPLTLKIGDVITPHFAHIKNNDCSTFAEGESEQHILGKHQLYNWLKNQSMLVNLEQFIPEIKQRPDLIVKHGAILTPIEFQCSSIAQSLVRKRSEGYKKVDLQPVWLPVSKGRFYKGLQKIQLSPFYSQFIEGQRLITYEPKNNYFHHYEHIIPIRGISYLANCKSVHASIQKFPFIQMKHYTLKDCYDFYHRWQLEKLHYIKQKIHYNRQGIREPFLKACYDAQKSPLALPNWIGIPTFKQRPKHAVEWQLIIVNKLKKTTSNLQRLPHDFIDVFLSEHKNFQITAQEVRTYLLFLSCYNPQLIHEDIKINSIIEEIYSQYVALKFDN
ncbi:competence protein CoiA [Kurthia sibirica]|uniref:Competence protein CoiA n=1 Tax=Kurthia sibirica TaxID=202750 RepID=A0A2U3AMW4_9BACL|nr:competence protein CoiA family protein [Kurthia sibirica]PWI25851.1 hypothetical protein DEX24_06510 [Kurthia sibirica]GEK34287.1 competence protein [Kurthia sibirica]